eukprot:scaffold1924_cov140-Skeletonema_menzelii.AAC.15
MKPIARSTSLRGLSRPSVPRASTLFAMASLLYCVGAANHISLNRPRHRRCGHPLFASTKQNYHLNKNNKIPVLSLFGVRGGGDDGLVQENPEYEPSKDSSVDNSDSDSTDHGDTSDGSDSEESDIEDEEAADEELLNDDVKDEEDDEEEVGKDLASFSKSKQSKQTSISKSNSSKQRSSVNKRLYKLWKHNQFNMYILLAIIAFRKDIYQFCIQYNIIPTQVNPITGERKIVVRWSTDVLKLILVVEVVRRCFFPPRSSDATIDDDSTIERRNQTRTDGVDEEMPTKPSPAVPLLLLLMVVILPTLLRHNISSAYTPLILPIVTSFIFRSIRGGADSDLMKWIMPALGDGDLATRMAYLPPLEQHYAFELLNERYYRDWGAWRKAFLTNPALQSHQYHLGRNDASGTGTGCGRMSAGSPMMSLIDAITSRKSSSSQLKQRKQSGQPKSKVSSLSNIYPHVYNNGTAIVLDMTKLDTQATSMERIRDQITFLVHLVQSEDKEFFQSVKVESEPTSNTTENITSAPLVENQATDVSPPQLEVIVLLESPGGSVSSYGLAASHLQRLRSTPGIKLTICVDSVAASGGYMMACMASPGQLLCAPFAMVGSIGVIGQSVNVQKALEKYGVRPYVFLGGKNKQPVGMFGDVTKDGMETMQAMIDRIHDSFREHVREAREESLVKAFVEEGDADKPPSNYFQLGSQTKLSHSQQSLDRVANGDVFLGVQALKLGLVDRLITSDEYIAERIQHGTRVLKLIIYRRPVGLSSLLMGPPHHSFAWKKWIAGAKNVASMISSTWSDSQNNVQLKIDTALL